MSTKNHNPFYLLFQKRFGPFFATQFFVAFNDNLFKNGLILLFAFQLASGESSNGNTLINLCAGLFILPFFLFSAHAGQLADKYDKDFLVRWIKFAEVLIVAFAGLGFYLNSQPLLITLLFLLGTQSTYFSPIKYSMLPEQLHPDELMKGNGLLEMGTFAAILLGTVCGTLLMALPNGTTWISIGVMLVALIGLWICLYIPKTPAPAPDLKVSWHPRETWRIIKMAYKNPTIFLTILAISWFWFFGSIFLAQIPAFTLLHLGGNEAVVTCMLMTFAIGIGVGSVLCDKLSGGLVELGLVPFGMIGLTIFMTDFSWINHELDASQRTLSLFLSSPHSIRSVIDVAGMGLFCGFYLVPLYTLIQKRTPAAQCSRIIAANNVINAIVMVGASVLAIVVLDMGYSIPQLFLMTAYATAIVSAIILYSVPEFVMRFIVWTLVSTIYRVDQQNIDKIPSEGPAILVCNHVSFLDPLLIMAVCRRPIRFVMYYSFAKIPIVGFVFKTAKTIPIASAEECYQTRETAYHEIVKTLQRGELVCIFPEGNLTHDGEIQPFKPGILHILSRHPVPVVPLAVKGLWGSFFSRKYGKVMLHFPRKWFQNKIGISASDPIPPEEFVLERCEQVVRELRGSAA